MRYGVRVNKISSKYRDRKAAPFHRRPQNYARRIARVLLSSPFSSRILLGIIEYLSPDLRRPSILSFREHLYAGPKSSHIIERSEELRRSLYSINCFGNAPVNERLADCDNYIIFALVNFNLSFSTLTEVASHRFKAEKKALFFICCFHTYTKIKRETPAWIDTLQITDVWLQMFKTNRGVAYYRWTIFERHNAENEHGTDPRISNVRSTVGVLTLCFLGKKKNEVRVFAWNRLLTSVVWTIEQMELTFIFYHFFGKRSIMYRVNVTQFVWTLMRQWLCICANCEYNCG